MRNDMSKVLCENPRFGHDRNFGERRKKKDFQTKIDADGESALGNNIESITKRYRFWDVRKEFNENLGPLRRFCEKSIGRKYDDVFSEICTTFDRKKVVNEHIIQHFREFISTEVSVGENGKLIAQYRWGRVVYLEDSSIDLYVDPQDGIIKRNKHRKSKKARQIQRRKEYERTVAENFRQISETLVLRKIDGVWYSFCVEPIPQPVITYVKPSAKHTFSYKGQEVSWNDLPIEEKAKVGFRYYHYDSYDEFLGRTVSPREFTHYHKNKRTASKRHLKVAGITE